MRICYLVNIYPGISNSFIRREIRALESAGVEVVRISIRPVEADQLVEPEVRAEQMRTRVLLDIGMIGLCAHAVFAGVRHPLRWLSALRQAIGMGWRSDRGLVRHIGYLLEACALAKWTADAGVEHVHAHFGTNPAAVAMLCHVLGGPQYSFTVHGPEEFDRPETLGLARKIDRASFVVGVSEFGRSQLWRWCPHEQWAKIHVVHCGVDEQFFGQARRMENSRRLVCVGRLSEQKGQLLLVEAAGKLTREGIEFELDLIGDGPMRGEIEGLIRRLKIERHVRLLGWKSGVEVCQAMLASRAMVLPSFAEGLPVVIMEALALGRPVISTYIAGTPELVEPGVNGWLVPAGSVVALVTAMREALETPLDKLTTMGEAGAKRVAEQHHAATEAKKLAKLFEEAIEGRKLSSGPRANPPARREGEEAEPVSLVGR